MVMFCYRLKDGEFVVLISDVGILLISDFGFILVRKCCEEGIFVIVLSGLCVVIIVLSVFGLFIDRFIFEGFLFVKV